MKVKLVIFDLDGTITQPFLDFDLIRSQIGLGDSNVPILEAMQKMTPEQVDHTWKVLQRHEKLAAINSTLNDGVHLALSQLYSRGIKKAILTRNERKNVLEVVRKHNLDFDLIYDRNDGPAKPDPAGIYHICQHFCVDPAETLMVGDYIHDLETARNAGCWAVLIKTHKQALEFTADADYVIDRIDQLIEIIDTIN